MLTVIWQTAGGLQTEFELEYVTKVLLREIPFRPQFDDGALATVCDQSLIVYSCDSPRIPEALARYLAQFDRAKHRYSLLHLSNESLKHRTDYYVRARHVFRGYFDPQIRSPNVSTIPIGFKSGFHHQSPASTPTASSRPYVWAFVGQLKSDRQEMYEAFMPIGRAIVHLTKAWACPTSLGVEQMTRIYEQTLFVPCPMGFTNPDSFRVCEALECGCIPIVRRFGGVDYFENVFGPHPIPTVSTWLEGARLASEIAQDAERAERLRSQVVSWYSGFRDRLGSRVSQCVAGKLMQ